MYVLSYDGFNETIRETERTKKEFEEMKAKREILQANASTGFSQSCA
jgi:hypothetical protein